MLDDINEYETSSAKHAELLSNFNITSDDENLLNDSDYTPKTEEIRQLVIYIRNYDKEGNFIENPAYAYKTCIDTFEKTIEKLSYYTKEKETSKDGTIHYYKKYNEFYKETSNTAVFADEEILKVKPNIIDSTKFFKAHIKNYFDQFKVIKTNYDRTLYIEFHNTENYKHYDLDTNDLNYFISKGYNNIGFNMDNHAFSILDNKLVELDVFSLENVKLKIDNEFGWSLSLNSFYLDSVEIDSNYTKMLPVLGITANEVVSLRYISFSNEICEFNFLSSQTKDAVKWRRTSIDIYGFEFLNHNKSYNFKLENILSFDTFYNVNLSSLNFNFDLLEISILKIKNCYNANLGSININATSINKTPISVTYTTDLTICSCFVTQKSSGKKVYLLHTDNGAVFGEYKLSSVIAKKIGFMESINDSISRLSYSNCKCIGNSKPLRWIGANISKMILNSCNFERLDELNIDINSLSVFGCNFETIKEVTIKVFDKLFISDSTFTGDKLDIVLSNSDTNALVSDSILNFNDSITIEGIDGVGVFKDTKTRVTTNDFKVLSLNRISTKDSKYKMKTVTLKTMGTNNFDPYFIDNRLKEVNITGKINKSLFFINNTSPVRIKYNVDYVQGNFAVFYYNKIADMEVNIDTSIVNMKIDTMDIEECKMSLKCLNDCNGSVITSNKKTIKIAPIAEGSFENLAEYTEKDNLNTSTWKNKIAYASFEK